MPDAGTWRPTPWVPPEDWVGHDIEEKPTVRESVAARLQSPKGKGLRVEEVSFSEQSLGRRSEPDARVSEK